MVRQYRHGPKPTIGLIGGIGAGKTTAARMLGDRGGRIVNADTLGHEAGSIRAGKNIYHEVARLRQEANEELCQLDRHARGMRLHLLLAAIILIVVARLRIRVRENVRRDGAAVVGEK